MRHHVNIALLVSVTFPRLLVGQTPMDSARARLAQIEGKLTVPGLTQSVEVRRDRWGVPHIYAKNQHDLFLAQGFVAAQDRLWQMDMWRRIGEGRLSEVLGPKHVERDKFARLMKYRGDMTAEWESYAPDTKEIVTAFVQGINAYIRQVRANPPIEYARLGFSPTPWRDDVPLQRMAALAMTGNALAEMQRAALVSAVGKEKAEKVWPTDPYRALDPDPALDLSGISIGSLGAAAAAYGPVAYSRLEGSNDWVVSGSKTASGKPLLANDPHRAIQLPSLRYLSHLVAPGWNVIGAGEPAVPGVAAGHNERIGFGFTIVGMDQQDVFVEEMGPCPNRPTGGPRCYRHDGAWTPLRVIIDTIPVKGEAPRVVRLEFTVHGPIVAEDTTRHRAFALEFVGAAPGTAGYLAQVSVDRARDWKSFQRAAARWKLPTENLVYADIDGNIGWVAAGLMPIRNWSGLLPVPGNGRYEWKGFVPFAQLPQAYNPPTGFIATSNNNILPPGYAIPLNYEWADPDRANRVKAVLGPATKLRREDFERLQHDDYSIHASELVPVLLAAAHQHRPGDSQVRVLEHWNYRMDRDSLAPLLFEAWYAALAERVFEPRAGATGTRAMGRAWDTPTLIKVVRNPDAEFGAHPADTRDSLVLAAWDDGLAVIRKRLGADEAKWTWGALHHVRFAHPLSAAFDLPTVSRGGSSHTVFMTGGADYQQTSGASFREVLDLADWDNSTATSVPGQSGQPGSPHYGDLLPLWAEGKYFPLVYSRAAVERETAHVLQLVPGGREGGKAGRR